MVIMQTLPQHARNVRLGPVDLMLGQPRQHSVISVALQKTLLVVQRQLFVRKSIMLMPTQNTRHVLLM